MNIKSKDLWLQYYEIKTKNEKDIFLASVSDKDFYNCMMDYYEMLKRE